jgi:hypothetical protein
MKTYTSFLILLWIGVLFILTPSTGRSQGLAEDTVQIPFTEDWSSGSFTTHNWSFPEGQGSWVVVTNYGDPSPSVAFYGYPTDTNYSHNLLSVWFDGEEFQCSDIWLDFDLNLTIVQPTGTENLTIGKVYDTTWIPLKTLKNDASFGWKHYHLYMGFANNHYFKIGFIASGANSTALSSWIIDNIHLDYVCQTASNLVETGTTNNDSIFLSWTPPRCRTGELTVLIYDDGTMENGWSLQLGDSGWFGNEFPVPGMSGTIESVSTRWFSSLCSNEQAFTVDFFDENHLLMATSDTFYLNYSNDDTWVTVPVNDVPFDGTFFAMLHWTPLTGCQHWLMDDLNGPYSAQDLAWFYDDTTWQKVSTLPVGDPGVFLIRVTAFINDEKKMTELTPGVIHEYSPSINDSMVMEGYNIYRKYPSNDSSFIRINSAPIPVTEYVDADVSHSSSGYYYYVTTLYDLASTNSFLCESASTDTVFASLTVGIGEKKEQTKLKVFPVPASTTINIQSDKTITGIGLEDHLGHSMMTLSNTTQKELILNVDGIKPGLYFLKVMTEEGVMIRKIMILH